MRLRWFAVLFVSLAACGWMLSCGFGWTQSEPRVEPVIRHPDRCDQDSNGIIDSLDDLIAQAMARGGAWRERTLVVTLWEPCTEWHLAQARALGGRIGYVYEHVCYGFSARLPIWAIPHLASDLGDSLCVIESPPPGTPCMDVATEIVRVRPVVWDSYCYKGDAWSSAAVIDSGVDTPHNDLGDDNDNNDNDSGDWYDIGAQGHDWAFTGAERFESAYKVVGWWDKTGSSGFASPVDYNGHGTHVSGILAGFGLVNSSYKGIAPRTRLVGLRTAGYFYDDVVEAMDEVVAQRTTYRIKACNMSWMFPDTPTLSDKADTMAANGVLPVVSAGNSWSTTWVEDPGRSEMAVTVGATNDSDEITSYSVSSAPGDPIKPDVVAPGGAGGTWQDGEEMTSCDHDPNDGYVEYRGTSMSSPIVAGVAGLVLQALGLTGESWDWYSDYYPREVKSLILMTAWETQKGETSGRTPPLNRGGKDNIEGYGRACADAAVEAASMCYTVGLTARGELGRDPGHKKVWARKIPFPAQEDTRLRLKMSSGDDYDLYVYSLHPDEHGEPVILYKSTSSTPGQTEEILRPSGVPNWLAYVVVKGVSFAFDVPHKFYLEASTPTNADEVWMKDFDSDDGTVTCLKTTSCGGFGQPIVVPAPASPDIRIVPDTPMPGGSAQVYVTIRNKTDKTITDASVLIYLYEPTPSGRVPVDQPAIWGQGNVSIPAKGAVELGPFDWDIVLRNSKGEPYWYIGAAVTTPRDKVRLQGSIWGEDNIAAKCITLWSVKLNPPGFGEHFDLLNNLDVGATAVVTPSRLDFPSDWDLYVNPPLGEPVHLQPGQTVTGELYLTPPESTSMGVCGVIDLLGTLIPDDDSAEYDMTGSMTIGLCTDEEFSDSDMSDWVVDSQGASVFIDTENYVSEPASMKVTGNPSDGAYASCTSPHVDLDLMKPYRLALWLCWEEFYEAKLLEFGHIRLLARSPSQALEYDPDGDWQNTVPIGPAFDSMLPSGAWGEVAVEVNPAEFEYTIRVNGTEVGTAPYDRWLEPVSRLHIEDQALAGSVLVANFDDIAPIGTPPEVEPIVYRSSSPSGWINPHWNMISIPLEPAGSWDAAHILGLDPTSHLFGWDRFGKTATYYGVQFTQMLPGEGYKLYTETEVVQPTYLGTKTHRPFEIALPKMGWSWIGCPSDSPVLLADCEIRNEATGATRKLSEDRFAADPWMNWAFYWWDSGKETWSYAGALQFPGIDDSLRPWRGYMTWQRTNDLTLIIP